MKGSFSGQLDTVPVKYRPLERKIWNAAIGKIRASFNFFDVYNYDRHHFLATEATQRLNNKNQNGVIAHLEVIKMVPGH